MFIEPILNEIHESWYEFIEDERVINQLKYIEKNVGNNYYPNKNNVLRFMKQDLNKVRYIIVGMDPYNSEYEIEGIKYPTATGRSFEVGNYNSWDKSTKNKSLTNILKAIYSAYTGQSDDIKKIREKIKSEEFNIMDPHELFDNLEKQGVLFLNYALTVEPHKAGSHINLWKEFSNMLKDYIIKNNSNAIWILWGKQANEELGTSIPDKNIISNCHPRLAKFNENNTFEQLKDINVIKRK